MAASSSTVRVLSVRAVGSRALLAELAGIDEVLAVTASLKHSPLPGQEHVIPAAATVLVIAHSSHAVGSLRTALLDLVLPSTGAHATGSEAVIDVVYDGEDLASVAALTGRSPEWVVAAHSGQTWTAAFSGFAPGFAYLVGDGSLNVPRLDAPRTAVPAGAVALAGNFSAVYPRSSPGGWQLIGRTGAVMWDLTRPEPALVIPGDTVRFRPVREVIRSTGSAARPDNRHEERRVHTGARVLSAGMLSLIEDLGRHGFQELGVPLSGAADRASLRRANRLVGNQPGAACIETVGGLIMQAAGDLIVAVTGAPAPLLVHSGRETRDDGLEPRAFPAAEARVLRHGEVLELGFPGAGFRSYVAIRGGLDVEPALGSRSTDTLSGLGPAALAAGQFLPVGTFTDTGVVGWPEVQPEVPVTGAVTELRIIPGPRDDWFDRGALELLCGQVWTVTPRSNRVGLRLSGEPLARTRPGELASEGMVAGALQVPPDGRPVLFLADHPVTGGYPVIAVVAEVDLALAAQVPLGGQVCFRML